MAKKRPLRQLLLVETPSSSSAYRDKAASITKPFLPLREAMGKYSYTRGK